MLMNTFFTSLHWKCTGTVVQFEYLECTVGILKVKMSEIEVDALDSSCANYMTCFGGKVSLSDSHSNVVFINQLRCECSNHPS